jgi:hypothetical protein
MPQADQLIQEKHRLRVFGYGAGKRRKTWWGLNAAEYGYRVLMFSGEQGHGIVQRLSPEARTRIYILDLHDGPQNALFAQALTLAFRTGEFYVNEETRQTSPNARAGFRHIDMRGFGTDTLVHIDTYSALVGSLVRRFAFENAIDLADAEKQEWPGYRYCGMLASHLLDQFAAVLNCHYYVVGHETQYEKYSKGPWDAAKKTHKPGPLEFSRRQPVSTSNPHGMNVSREFDHVLHFSASGGNIWIDTKGDDDNDAGSRALPNDKYLWENLNFEALAQTDGCAKPNDFAPPFESETNFNIIPDALASVSKGQPEPLLQTAAAKAAVTPLATRRPSLVIPKR